ncbi:MAG: hypothetical protein NTZ09_11060 [Candidatus Hydrogenedentes bacterium]|nr:hypothetical protein [Candidatus Hydrogenedentota bacterium]
MIARRAAVRNTMVVLCLFGLAALAIIVAQFRGAYVPYEEPPDLVAKRLDRENNAHYALLDAAALLPLTPPEIGYVKDETGFESKFKPEPGSVGELLRVWRPDADPLLLEFVEKSKPALELARAAASKPYFLFPPVDWTASYQQLERPVFQNLLPLYQLRGLLVLDSASKSCSANPAEDACRLMQQALELSFTMNADRYHWFEPAETFATNVIRKSCIEHQREMLQWLDQTRHDWTPPRAAIEFAIRNVLEADLTDDPNYRPNMWRRFATSVEMRMAFSHAKLFVRRHEKLYRDAAQLTFLQYNLQKEKFKPLQTPPRRYFDLSLHGASVNANSRFFARVDGLRIAIALESYRHDHASYPDSLDSLAPDYFPKLPECPYDGTPFDYRRESDDYALSCTVLSVSYYPSVSHAGKLIFHMPAGMEAAP